MTEKKKCVFAGTFDPPTIGHKKIVDDCLEIFDEVVVAVMVNAQKSPLLTEEERASLLEKLFENKRVKVRIFEGAAVDILEEENTPFYVRGVRNTVDFEYENADYFASKKLKKDMIVIYIPAEQENLHISSTLVKNPIKFNKDFADYIPEEIRDDLLKILKTKD